MKNPKECNEHGNNFKHYEPDLDGFEKQFHLAIKLYEEDPEQYGYILGTFGVLIKGMG